MKSHRNRWIAAIVSVCVLGIVLSTASSGLCASSSGYSQFFIPGDEALLMQVLDEIGANDQRGINGYMHSVITLTVWADDTTVYYDHWENGYGFDPDFPVSTADETYSLSNRGDSRVFESANIPTYGTVAGGVYGRDPTDQDPSPVVDFPEADPPTNYPYNNYYYDGRDRIYVAGGAATVSRAGWTESADTLLAVAWEVYPVRPQLTTYILPFGEDLVASGYDDFERVFAMVQATQDGTTIQVDLNKDDVYDNLDWDRDGTVDGNSTTLNAGEVFLLDRESTGGQIVRTGTRIQASDTVQVQYIIGDEGSNYEIRGLSAFPRGFWDDEYYAPVDGPAANYPTDIFLYNPHNTTLTVTYEVRGDSDSFTIPSKTTLAFSDSLAAGITVPEDTAVYLKGSDVFWGISVIDTENTRHDWGYSLVPAFLLENEHYLGWAPGYFGTETGDGTPEDDSGLYVSAAQDHTTLFVDYDSDGFDTGQGDVSYDLDRLETVYVYNPDDSNPDGMSYANIYATGPYALSYGQNPDTATPAEPAIDVGYTTIPGNDFIELVFTVEKTVEPSLVPLASGSTAEFTLKINTHGFSVDDISVEDAMPTGWEYVSGTTSILFPDGSTAATDPAGTGTLTWGSGLLGDMGSDQELVITFTGRTTQAFASGDISRNDVKATGSRTVEGVTQTFSTTDFAIMTYSGAVMDVEKTTETADPVSPGDIIDYTIEITHESGDATFNNVTLYDPLPEGVSYVANSSEALLEEWDDFQDDFSDGYDTASTDAGGNREWEDASWSETDLNGGGASSGSVSVSGETLLFSYAPGGSYDIEDQFNANGDYTGDDGTATWVDDSWTETNDDDSASDGAAQVTGNQLQFAPISGGTENYRDAFDSGTDYDQSDGSIDWSGDSWVEENDSDLSSTGGRIRLDGDNDRLVFTQADNGDAIARSAVVSGADYVKISFNIADNGVEAGEAIQPEWSPTGQTGTWVALGSPLSDGVNGTYTFNLGDYSWTSSNDTVYVRFRATSNWSYFNDEIVINWVNIDVTTCVASSNYRDDFDTGTGYNQSDGTVDWSSVSWVEVNDFDLSSTGGRIQLDGTDDELQFLQADNGDAIARSADVTDAESVTVSFYFEDAGIESDQNEGIWPEWSSDGSSYTTLGTAALTQGDEGEYSFDLGDYGWDTDDDTVYIRFRAVSDWNYSNDQAYIHWVSIDYCHPKYPAGVSVERTAADLSDSKVTAATLDFEASASNLESGDEVDVDVWDGDSWETVDTYVGGTGFSGTAPYSIYSYRNSETKVRFNATSGFQELDESFSIDNVQISFTTSGGSSGSSVERRAIDLTGYSGYTLESAELSFDYAGDPDNETGDIIVVETSPDGATYSEVARYDGVTSTTSTGSGDIDIQSYASGDLRLRFRALSGFDAAGETFSIDNVNIELDYTIKNDDPSGVPPNFLGSGDDYDLSPARTLTFTYQVQVDDPLAPGIEEILNTAWVNAVELLAPLSDDAVNVVSVPGSETGTVGDKVWLDVDGDGVLDLGESGIAGVTVTLKSLDGTPLDSMETDSEGRYLFTDVPLGEGYYVEVTDNLPAGLTQTTDSRTDDRTDSFGIVAAGDYLDEFGAASYANSDGSLDWADFSSWIESDGANSVDVYDGYLDMDGDDSENTPDGGDDGTFEGYTIIDGGVDINDSGGIGDADDGVIGGYAVINGRVDIDNDGDGDGDEGDDGTITAPASADGGDIQIVGGRLRINGYNGGTSNSIRRALLIPDGATSATLTFDYQTSANLDSGDSIVLEVATDGGDTYSTLATYTDETTALTSANIDLTSYLSLDTRIRFRVASGYGDSADQYFYIDNVRIQYSGLTDYEDADIGYEPESGTAIIGDLVWSDADGDKKQDSGEPGLGGVEVRLYPDVDGDRVSDDTTLDVIDGRLDLDGDNDITAKDTGYAGDRTIIAGKVDVNGDGIVNGSDDGDITFDNGTPLDTGDDTTYSVIDGQIDFNGVGGVTGADDGTTPAGEHYRTTVTAANGSYQFSVVASGSQNYIPAIDAGQSALSDYELTTPSSYAFLGVDDGESLLTADFGVRQDGTEITYAIKDRVWLDSDADGLQDAGESGIADVTVELLNSSGAKIASTTTDSNGDFSFTGVPAGVRYRWSITDQNNVLDDYYGTTSSAQSGQFQMPNTLDEADDEADGTDDDVLEYNDPTNPEGYRPNFGYNLTRTIGDTVFNDLDGDGTQDANEPGFSGIAVKLYTDVDGDGVIDAGDGDAYVATLTTTDDGKYLFSGLSDGNYTVSIESPPSGYNYVSPSPGQPPDSDSGTTGEQRSASLTGGVSDLDNDFGYKADTVWTISGTVWEDKDEGSDIDASEDEFSGVTVELYSDTGTAGVYDGTETRLAVTSTDANGDYSFMGVLDGGDYFVRITDENGVLSDYKTTYEGPSRDGDGSDDDGTHDGIQFVTDLEEDEERNFGYFKEQPTYVRIVSFEMFQIDGRSVVQWRTAGEIGTLGYDLLGIDKDGTVRNINKRPIPAAPFEIGGVYQVVDETADPAASQQYRLIERLRLGGANRHGPYVVQADTSRTPDGSLLPDLFENGFANRSILPMNTDASAADESDKLSEEEPINAYEAKAPAVPLAEDSRLKIVITEKGLYRVDAADISEALNATEESIVEQIGRNRIRMSCQGESVAHMPSEDGRSVYFYGRSHSTFYTDQNVYWMEVFAGPEKGDANMDGVLDSKDLVACLAVLAGDADPGLLLDFARSGADVNGNGKADISEALFIARQLLSSDEPAEQSPLMEESAGDAPGDPMAGLSFETQVHAEKDLYMNRYAKGETDDLFIWDMLFYGSMFVGNYYTEPFDAFEIDVPAPAGVETADLTVNLLGMSDNDHVATITLNPGTDREVAFEDDIAWSGLEVVSRTFAFEGEKLFDGVNWIKVESGRNDDAFGVDSFDLAYFRSFEAHEGSLHFHSASHEILTVSGFDDPSAEIELFDLSDPNRPKRIMNATRNSGDLTFEPRTPDTPYLAVDLNVAKIPDSIVADIPSDLKSVSNEARYLVIAGEELVEGAGRLAQHRTNDFSTRVVLLSEVFDEFSYGVFDPFAVRDFIAHAVENWAEPPEYVVLAGNGTVDPKEHFQWAASLWGFSIVNRFPVLLVWTPDGYFGSDNQYADIDGDGLPEVALGRIPAADNDDMDAVIDKMVAYESAEEPPETVLMVADAPDGPGENNFPSDSLLVAQSLGAGTPAVHLSFDDYDDTNPPETGQQMMRDEFDKQIEGVEGGHKFLVNYIGHGNPSSLSDFYKTSHLSDLENSHYPIFAAFTCLVGQFEVPQVQALSKVGVLQSESGFVAALTPSGLSYNSQAVWMNQELFRQIYGIGTPPAPDLGSAFRQVLIAYGTQKAVDYSYMGQIYNILGDPALPLSR